MPRDLDARWLLRVEKEGHGGCWRWTGAMWANGYGKFSEPGTQRRISAHRWGYEHFVGPRAGWHGTRPPVPEPLVRQLP